MTVRLSPARLGNSMARVLIRRPTPKDEMEFLARVRASRVLHRPWVYAPSTVAQFHDYLQRVSKPENAAFFVCLREEQSIVGVINISNVVLGAFRSGYLGFYCFSGHERRGLMREGLEAVVQHAFVKLKLHRLEANIQPDNVASRRLVKACGFSKEGYSPRYLKIGGRWRDHERWAIVAT